MTKNKKIKDELYNSSITMANTSDEQYNKDTSQKDIDETQILLHDDEEKYMYKNHPNHGSKAACTASISGSFDDKLTIDYSDNPINGKYGYRFFDIPFEDILDIISFKLSPMGFGKTIENSHRQHEKLALYLEYMAKVVRNNKDKYNS